MCAFFKSILFFRFNESFQKGLFHSLATVNIINNTVLSLRYFDNWDAKLFCNANKLPKQHVVYV